MAFVELLYHQSIKTLAKGALDILPENTNPKKVDAACVLKPSNMFFKSL
jgi:hypothetical protein